MGELRRRKQALSAVMYGGAHPMFVGNVLWLQYQQGDEFFAEMAQDPKHEEIMKRVFEDVIGSQPSEVRVTIWGKS